jgi:predicted O-linked N-acetylglucosamine transferase (SPINDLY family)
LKPGYAEALNNCGIALFSLGQRQEAANAFEQALSVNPDLPFLRGMLLYSKMHCCDWRSHEDHSNQLIADVRDGKPSTRPMPFLTVSSSAKDQLCCAQTFIDAQCPPSPTPLWRGEQYRHDRIRLAYLSADLQDHAVSHLMAGLFERHDRTRFSTTAISFSADAPSEMRSRLKGAFEYFIDVREQSDAEVANRLREMEIDIAVDLNGFTSDARTGIFALRPAPVQVNYLGYPGTMGAPYIDYILADAVVIPNEHRTFYAEQVVYLPDTFQPNDCTRHISASIQSRSDAGLPAHGFVFCSFNNSYKITPAVFDIWMRLLRQVKRSVLWLQEGNAAAPDNLRREAADRGIDPDRLVFAAKMPKIEDHLARYRLADLFLDTLPYNAHATASDALWAGVPLLTCLGATFAGRVAASALSAIGLPELIAHSLAEYESIALKLATDLELLAKIRQKLSRYRDSYPLFDTDLFRHHIEAAYVTMWQRSQRGELPASFEVARHHPLLK